jgi:hypothetical protein
MKGRLPQITLPTGAPNPFDKQNVTLSTNLPARKQQQRSGMGSMASSTRKINVK